MTAETVFWEHFRKQAPAWASLLDAGRQRLAFEEIAKLLDESGFPYCFDLTQDESACCFILSPEGDHAVATKIDELVTSAPSIPNWKLYARRQRKPLADACAIIRKLYLVDPSAARFRCFKRNGTQFIQMFVSSDADLESGEQRGLINTFLWHALGEDVVMAKDIGGEMLLANPPSEGTLSAAEIVTLF